MLESVGRFWGWGKSPGAVDNWKMLWTTPGNILAPCCSGTSVLQILVLDGVSHCLGGSVPGDPVLGSKRSGWELQDVEAVGDLTRWGVSLGWIPVLPPSLPFSLTSQDSGWSPPWPSMKIHLHWSPRKGTSGFPPALLLLMPSLGSLKLSLNGFILY